MRNPLKMSAVMALAALLVGTASAQFDWKKKLGDAAKAEIEKALEDEPAQAPEVSGSEPAGQTASASPGSMPRNPDGSWAALHRDYFFRAEKETAIQRAIDAAKAIDPSCTLSVPVDTSCGGSCSNFVSRIENAKKTFASAEISQIAWACAREYNAAVGAKDATEAAVAAPVSQVAAAPPANPQAPKSAVTATSDPIVAHCEQSSQARTYYDCGCMGTQAAAARAATLSDPQRAAQVKAKQNQVAAMKSELATTTDPNRRSVLERSIQGVEKQISELNDPMSVNSSELMVTLGQQTTCRVPGSLKSEQYESCMKSGSSLTTVANPQAYCTCVGEAVADDWVSGRMAAFNSKTLVQSASRARAACRG